jgi:hypothetical protein
MPTSVRRADTVAIRNQGTGSAAPFEGTSSPSPKAVTSCATAVFAKICIRRGGVTWQ